MTTCRRVLDTLKCSCFLIRIDRLMIVTGSRPRRGTVSATLPRSARPIPDRLWLATTSRSMSWSVAYSRIARAGLLTSVAVSGSVFCSAARSVAVAWGLVRFDRLVGALGDREIAVICTSRSVSISNVGVRSERGRSHRRRRARSRTLPHNSWSAEMNVLLHMPCDDGSPGEPPQGHAPRHSPRFPVQGVVHFSAASQVPAYRLRG